MNRGNQTELSVMRAEDPKRDIEVYDTLGPLTRRALDECRFRASAIGVVHAAKQHRLDLKRDDAKIADAIRSEDAKKPGWAI